MPSRLFWYLTLFGGAAIWMIFRRKPRRKRLPPCPKTSCFVVVKKFMDSSSSGSIITFIHEQSIKLGPVFRLSLPEWAPFVVVCDSALARVVLEGEEDVPACEKIDRYHVIDHITLDCPSIVSRKNKAEGWDWARKGVSHNFSNKCLYKELYSMSHCRQNFCALLSTFAAQSAEIDLKQLVDRYTLDFLGISMFHANFHAIHNDPTSLKFLEEMTVAMTEYGQRQYFNSFRHFMFWYRDVKRAKEAGVVLESFVNSIVNQYLARRQSSEVEEDDSILGHLMRSPYESDKELEADVLCLLLSGHAHTSNTILWTVLEISRHPAVLEKLRREIDSVNFNDYGNNDNNNNNNNNNGSSSGEVNDNVINVKLGKLMTEINRLEYLQDVVNESMRLWPVNALGVFREASVNITYDDYKIPQGATLMIPFYTLFRTSISNPDEFIPERWSEKSAEVGKLRELFVPFSSGPRNCVGQNLAMMEIKMMLVMLLKKFDFEPVPCVTPAAAATAATTTSATTTAIGEVAGAFQQNDSSGGIKKKQPSLDWEYVMSLQPTTTRFKITNRNL